MPAEREPTHKQIANHTIDVAHESWPDAAEEIVQIVSDSTDHPQND